MAYTKHTWKERLGTKLNRFKDLLTGNHVELINDPESVIQQGTPLRADWLNEMEQGIFDAHTIGEAARDTADGLADGTIQAGDAAKLGGVAHRISNDILGTVVRRHYADNSIHVGRVHEDGTALSLKYLGISAQAADSEKLAGYTPALYATANTIVRRTSAGNILAEAFSEGGTYLMYKYAPITRYGTSAPPSTGTPGSIYIQY